MRLHVAARDFGAEEQAAQASLGTEKLTSPVSTIGLTTTTLPPRAADGHQRPHHPRMVAGRVAADEHHEVALLHVVELDRAVPAADHAGQAHAAGLVAVVASSC